MSGERASAAAAVATCVVVLLLVAGCDGTSIDERGDARTRTASSRAAGTQRTAPVEASAGSSANAAGCAESTSVALQSALTNGWARPWPPEIVPFNGSNVAGTQIVANVRTATSSKVVLLDVATHAVIRAIAALPSSGAQAGGVFNGEYAVWKESDTPGQLDPFVVKVWTAATGKVDVVGGSQRMRGGDLAPSPWQDPVLAGTRAAWVEGTDAQGAGDIVVLDLASRRRTIGRRGHPGWIALTASTLIWAESDRPGAATTIRAQDPSSGAAVAVPEPLASASGAWGFVTDGKYWAWVANDPESMFGGPIGGTAREIARIPLGGASPPLAISHGMAVVPVSAGGLVFSNLRTGGWAFAERASWATQLSDGLLVSRMVMRKDGPGERSLAVVKADSIATLHC